jgi:ATP-binding cassette subfamily C protein
MTGGAVSGSAQAADPTNPRRSELAAVLSTFNRAFGALAAVSGVNNLLMLTGAFFMLEVYDRVLPSRSVPTLVGLTILAVILYAFSGLLEVMRARILTRIGIALDQGLGGRVFDAVVRLPLKARGGGDGLQPLRDLDTIRAFLAGGGPPALFDLPWLPIYLGICFYFHFLIGLSATIGAIVLVGITGLTEHLTRGPTTMATEQAIRRNSIAQASRQNAEVLYAMGMSARLSVTWQEATRGYLAAQERASDVASSLGTFSRVLRLFLQSALLGVGAYLVIQEEATSGVIIAGSIIGARALAPVDMAIANWRPFITARQSWSRINQLLSLFPKAEQQLQLPRPQLSLQLEDVSVVAPGDNRIIVQNASFSMKSGQAVCVIGPTASGKSSLARAIVGVWSPVRGKVRLDSAALEQWSPERLGPHIGYLPQDVELFDGTVAQNIARFEPDANAAAIIAAAEAAGVHELVLRLPQGYETRIGEGGAALSAGQRQRIGLARALFGEPFLVVLDEPNANLDADGEQALTQAVLKVRARGGVVVLVAHRPSALAAVDLAMFMFEGRIQLFGPKDEVLSKVVRPAVGTVPVSVPRVAQVEAKGAAG